MMSPAAAGCVAAKAMAAGTAELEQRKDLLQRREWLLLEYLSSEGTTPALAQCPLSPWAELGLCLDKATRRQ